MSQNNKTILITTLVNYILLGLVVSPWFEDMNILSFLIIGFLFVCASTPLISLGLDDENDK